eukprot:12178650-Alexandrium_andersonii.AAC.1
MGLRAASRRRPSPGSSGCTGHASVAAARVWQLSSLLRASQPALCGGLWASRPPAARDPPAGAWLTLAVSCVARTLRRCMSFWRHSP